MARPCKYRTVHFDPSHTYFKPRGVPISELEEVELGLDELGAIKLADIEGLYHEDAAKKMNISRQTFDRILIKAHKTIADALINGKAILIKGGNVMSPDQRSFKCSDCNHSWSIAYGLGRPNECPDCQSKNIHRMPIERGPRFGRGVRGGRGLCRRDGKRG